MLEREPRTLWKAEWLFSNAIMSSSLISCQNSSLRKDFPSWGDGSVGKSYASLRTQHSCEKPGIAMHGLASEMKGWRWADPRSTLVWQLSQTVSSRFSERPCLQAAGPRRTGWQLVYSWPLRMCEMCVTCPCTHLQTTQSPERTSSSEGYLVTLWFSLPKRGMTNT